MNVKKEKKKEKRKEDRSDAQLDESVAIVSALQQSLQGDEPSMGWVSPCCWRGLQILALIIAEARGG